MEAQVLKEMKEQHQWTEWVEELEARWERTITKWNEEHLQACEYHKGYVCAVRDILKDLRAGRSVKKSIDLWRSGDPQAPRKR